MVREIVRCQHCGFCWGVRRAVDLALNLADAGWNVFADGELVHNPGVLRTLAGRGVQPWDGAERKWGPRDCVLIRAHGIRPERRTFLRQLSCSLFDGTCPEVAKVAGKIRLWKNRGHSLLLFGDVDHPETKGLMAYGGKSLRVVRDQADLDRLPKLTGQESFVLLAQTTADEEEFGAFAQALQERCPASRIEDTICASTRIRKKELRNLLKENSFDAVVLVGGLHSSNTLHLAATARAMGQRVFHVEDAQTLADVLPAQATILLASGTSTPEAEVDATERVLRGLSSD